MTDVLWATDADIEAHDRAVSAAAEHEQLDRAVEREVLRLRATAAARARLAAEGLSTVDFSGEYLDRADLIDLVSPDALIPGVLPGSSYGVLRGRDHTFKSFIAIDWALSVATGRAWLNREVTEARVLYIAGEGAQGVIARIDAWETDRGVEVPAGAFTLRRSALNLHRPGPDFDDLLDRVSRGNYGLVVVDTLRRVSGGADGNSSDMSAVIDNLDLVKRAMDGGTVVVVAHTDKGDGDTRGYSGIEDDADFVWAAKRKANHVALKLTKMKDGPDGTTLTLAATAVNQSLVLHQRDDYAAIEDNENIRRVFAVVASSGDAGCSAAEVIERAGVARATGYRILDGLVVSGRVSKIGPRSRSRYCKSADSQ